MPSVLSLSEWRRRLQRARRPTRLLKPARLDPKAREAAATTDRIRRLMLVNKEQPDLLETSAADSIADSPPGENTRRLWGYDFSLTEQGLSEAQVISFVETLLAHTKQLEEQSTPAAMTLYAHKLMGELQQLEETIQTQAKREAEAEATKITDEAQHQAQEIFAQTHTEAIDLARREAKAILTAARQKVAMVDEQVRMQTQTILLKAREQIHEHIRQEGELAYRRMSNSLNSLTQEALRLESEWEQETALLLESGEIRQALESMDLAALPTIREALDSGEPSATLRQPLASQLSDIQDATGISPRRIQRETLAQDEVELPLAEAEREPIETTLAASRRETPFPKRGINEASEQVLYNGELDLVLTPPVDPALLARLYSRLLAIPDVRILRTAGSWENGSTITLLLKNPQPLVRLLLETPDIQIIFTRATEAPSPSPSDSLETPGVSGKRIEISLRE